MISEGAAGRDKELVEVFRASFSAAEGKEAGDAVAGLAQELLTSTPTDDMFVFSSWEDDIAIGCIIFTRLTFAGDDRTVFMLSPVAVGPDHQGQGVGQQLIGHGLDALRRHGVDIAGTYGDPNYYAKVGFRPVAQDVVPPPQPLSKPHGWIAQSLTDAPLVPLAGPSRCAPAFDNPEHW